MSLVQVQGTASTDRRPSPVLSSNNPFRNRTTSPTNSIPQSPVNASFSPITTAPERPTSRNPFLDNPDRPTSARPTSPLKDSFTMEGRASPAKPALTGHAVELFDNLTLNDDPPKNQPSTTSANPPPYSSRPRPGHHAENQPPRQRGPPPSGHNASRSQEERYMNGSKPRRGTEDLNVFADPPKTRTLRNRRNSDSSLASRMLSPEEEARRKERHRKEREARHRDGRHRHHTSSGKSKRPPHRLDIIDNLDVTSIYGKGLFHHDGPFDACNPDRNRKGSRRAPMEAFAKDSANNAIGGSGPVNSQIDLAQFHGRGVEGFNDYAASGVAVNPPAAPQSYVGSSALHRKQRGAPNPLDRQSSFNATENVQPIYGQESMGLGASTFLEGTPAAKSAIQRRESESDPAVDPAAGGLGRKRSLAQRIRGISNAGRDKGAHRPLINSNNRVVFPDNSERPQSRPGLVSGESQSAGGMPKIHETRPFFQDYNSKQRAIQIDEKQNRQDDAEDGRRDSFGQEETITVAGKDVRASGAAGMDAISAGRARALSSPKRETLERRVTHDGTNGGAESIEPDSKGGKDGGGGFLNRVKSLKGGRRNK